MIRTSHLFSASFIAAGAVLLGAAPVSAQSRPIVNVYTWSDYIAPRIIDGFKRETGIELRCDTFDSNDTLEAKLLAGKSGYQVVVLPAHVVRFPITAGVCHQLPVP